MSIFGICEPNTLKRNIMCATYLYHYFLATLCLLFKSSVHIILRFKVFGSHLSDISGGAYYLYAIIDDAVGEPAVVYSQQKILIAGIPASERDALIAFYESTNGYNWVKSDNWLSDSPVNDWYGVSLKKWACE